MQFLITFLEGVISFLSPCMLPMLPLYLSYFAAGTERKSRVLLRVFGFVLGFTVVFSLLGLFAGSIGGLLARYRTAVNLICGLIVILLGLGYLEVIQLPFLRGMQSRMRADSVIAAFLFGMVYSVSLTPCVGAFLGSALSLAALSGTALQGVLLLVTYSLGLGVPFLLCAVLLDRLNGAFRAVKEHYKGINLVCGGFLVVLGVVIATGGMNMLLNLFV